MLKIGNNTHYTRQQVQNNNTTLHCKNDGETVQHYNSLPHRLQNIREVRKDTFNIHLARWLRDVPDTPKIRGGC